MNWEGHHTICTEILLKMFHLHLIRKRQSDKYRTWCVLQVNMSGLVKMSMAGKKKKMKETVLKYRRLKKLNQKQSMNLD